MFPPLTSSVVGSGSIGESHSLVQPCRSIMYIRHVRAFLRTYVCTYVHVPPPPSSLAGVQKRTAWGPTMVEGRSHVEGGKGKDVGGKGSHVEGGKEKEGRRKNVNTVNDLGLGF